MAKTLSFTDTSAQTVKIGDTTTSFTMVLGNDNIATDLTNATSITVKIGNSSGYLKSATVNPASLTDPTTGQITVTFNADLMTSLTAGSYSLEVWMVDSNGTSIYPSDGSTGFTITNNIQSSNGSTITTITFDDFVKAMNKTATAVTTAALADYDVTPDKLLDATTEADANKTQLNLSGTNTQMMTGVVFSETGTQISSNQYNSILVDVTTYSAVDLINYQIGVNGGAFLDRDKNWISSFSTADGTETQKIVPTTAKYIAITVPLTNPYRTIGVTSKIKKYILNNLVIKALPDLLPGTISASALTDYQAAGGVGDSDTIKLSESNTTLQSGTYTSNGEIYQDATNTYATLIFNCAAYSSINLSQYVMGVNGGAFLDRDKNWISSFSTADANDNPKAVPDGAQFIAITVKIASPYSTIIGTRKIGKYTLSGLVIPKEDTPAAETIWTDKKIVWIGTSVSFGANATSSYPDIASKMLGFDLINASVPGLAIHTANDGKQLTYGSSTLSVAEYAAQGITIATAPEPYVPGGTYNNYYRTWEHVFNADTADADLYVFDVAPNNTNFAMDDWDAFDKSNWKYTDGSNFANHRTTFVGALLFLMDKMYALNPQARMCFVLGSTFAYGDAKAVFDELSEAWNIPIINAWGQVNTSPKSLVQLKSKNGTNDHPSDFGHSVLGKVIASKLTGIA